MGAVDLGGSKPAGGGGQSWKRPRVKIRIDMTPMVDIAFLLLIFFMVTTVFRLPTAMEMVLPPPDEIVQPVEVFKEKMITFLVMENDSLAYFVGTEAPKPLTWDSLHYKLQERRAKLMKGDVEQVETIDRIITLSDTNLIKYEERYGDEQTFDRIDLAIKRAELPAWSRDEKVKLLNDIKEMDKLIVIAKIHKKARYMTMVDLIDELNVARSTRFSIDKFTVYEDSLLRINGFETSGPEGLPVVEFEYEDES
ncbi:biopolymer transporter ExbD [bacterium]|nr:biopolymer transporter ExbD [bacterium]